MTGHTPGGEVPTGARALGPGDLVLAAATLCPGGDTPLATAVDAAIAGGFSGLSVWASTYLGELGRGSGPDAQRALVEQAGLVVDHVEAVIAWVGSDDPGAPYAEEALPAQVFEAAGALGAGTVSVLLFGRKDAHFLAAAEVFADIAEMAAGHGLRAALEFAPGTVVPDVATAARIAGATPAGGILYDTWHAHFGPTAAAGVDGLDGSRVLAVQVSDGPAARPSDYGWATRRSRLIPGEGATDPWQAVSALRSAGCMAPLTLEVFNDRLVAEVGPRSFCRELGRSARRVTRP